MITEPVFFYIYRILHLRLLNYEKKNTQCKKNKFHTQHKFHMKNPQKVKTISKIVYFRIMMLFGKVFNVKYNVMN